MSTKVFFLLFIFLNVLPQVFAQPADSTDHKLSLSGSGALTTNGISVVPTFSLNKPAAMFKFSAGKSRFSFDPEFNFSLAGKPWYFLFWFRYKLLTAGKFRINGAAQLGLNFRTTETLVNLNRTEVTVAERYLAAEIVPTYSITKNITLGTYYLHSHGIDPGTTNSLDFLTVNASFSNIKIVDGISMKFTPQFYYLRQDGLDGTYLTSALTLAKKGFPVSLSSMMNQVLQTDIPGGKNFVWNLAVVYAFESHRTEM